MRNVIAYILVGFGIISVLVSSGRAHTAPNGLFLVGMFLPGLFGITLGLALRKPRPRASSDTNQTDLDAMDARLRQLLARGEMGVIGGITLMGVGGGMAQQNMDSLWFGSALALAGWGLMIWGCVNYIRWKGYSGWFGLLGYLFLLGVIILACMPNRRKRPLGVDDAKLSNDEAAVWADDQAPGHRYLLGIVPVGLLGLIVSAMLYSVGANIAAADWTEVTQPQLGFQASMPGTPRLDDKTQETPAGNIELHKYIVEPKGKKELFMIVTTRLPAAVGQQMGGAEKLLDLGRKDLLAALTGTVKSEKRIALAGSPGLELEVLPPKGAIVKAQIFATNRQIYQLWVHVPKMRLMSSDVQRYFDSFQLVSEQN